MPKYRNPRILVAFKPHEFEVIKRLAAVTGTTMSKAVHGQLEAVLPILEKVVATLERAKEAEGLPRAKMLAAAVKLHADMDLVAAQALDQFDMFTAIYAPRSAAGASGATAAPAPALGDVKSDPAETRTKPRTRPTESPHRTRKRARRGK